MAKGNMTIRMEPELKAQAAALFRKQVAKLAKPL